MNLTEKEMVLASDGFRDYLQKKRLDTKTVDIYLKRIRTWICCASISPEEFLDEIRNSSRSPATASQYRSILIQFFDYLVEKDLVPDNLWRATKFPGKSPITPIKIISENLSGRIIENDADLRNEIMVRIVVECGAMPTEMIQLDQEDVDVDVNQCIIRFGGRSKKLQPRWFRLGNELASLLKEYLDKKIESSGPLFTSLRSNKRLDRTNLWRAIKSWTDQNPRELRNIFAQNKLKQKDIQNFWISMGYKTYHGAWHSWDRQKKAKELSLNNRNSVP